MNFYYLNQDVISSTSKKTYALKGEKVFIIGDHDNAVTVMSESGNKFGVSRTSLSQALIPKDVIIIQTKTKQNGKKNKTR
jgi:hypothetical protein